MSLMCKECGITGREWKIGNAAGKSGRRSGVTYYLAKKKTIKEVMGPEETKNLPPGINILIEIMNNKGRIDCFRAKNSL